MIEYTRVKLSQWGRWCRGRPVTGYPTAAAFTWANTGGKGSSGGLAPDDILETEQAVARLGQAWKQPLVAYYVSTGPLWLKAQRLNISRRTLMRRVETAERKVAEALDSAPKS